VIPHPYTHPSQVLKELLALDDDKLEKALESKRQLAHKMGKLGTLVKFFAWGFPVHAKELWQALGRDDAVEALTRCNILTKCNQEQQLYASAVQFFPVEATSVVVATDWHTVSSREYGVEKPINAVDDHMLTLVHNTPVAEGKRVLDLSSGSGVWGLTALDLGAKEAVILAPTDRATRFAYFNAGLNRVGNRVKVVERSLAEGPKLRKSSFYLVLADHDKKRDAKETDIHTILKAAKPLISENGAMLLGFRGRGCENFKEVYNRDFCGNTWTGDFTGNIVCKSADKAHRSQEGIVYGWRIPIENRAKNKFKCGHFKTAHLRSFDIPYGAPACRFSRTGMQCRVLNLR